MDKRNKILVITNPKDPHTDAVIHFLYKMGFDVVRFHVAEAHQDANITISGESSDIEIVSSHRRIAVSEIRSVWYRRPDQFEETVTHLEYPDKYLVSQETKATLWGLYGRIDAPWFSHPYNIRRAAWKLFQLSIAANLRFNIPPYLISNDVSSIREFLAVCGEVIMKPIDEKTTFFEEDGKSYSLYVKKFSRNELEELTVKKPISPIYLQKYVHKKYDVRVTVIGKKIFPVAIKSNSEDDLVDFRPLTLELTHEPIDCPPELEKVLLEYMRKMGLNFAAFDFVFGTDGLWYFLECNPNGQWLWIEIKTGLPMVETFARHLTLQEPPLISGSQVI